MEWKQYIDNDSAAVEGWSDAWWPTTMLDQSQYIMRLYGQEGYYVASWAGGQPPQCWKVHLGPFETLDAAKVAYILLFGTGG